MDNHTKEPWRVYTYPQGDSDIFDSNDRSIISGSTGLIDIESNASRIVACVNACAGLSTVELELVAAFGERLCAKCVSDKYKAQRDELLEALIEYDAYDLVPGAIREAIKANAKAAVAKVKECAK